MIRPAALAAIATLAGCDSPRPAPVTATLVGDGYDCWVSEVVDGDTVRLRCADDSGGAARLIGFDTPETYRSGCEAEALHGARATDMLRQRIARARRVDITTHGRDRYNRMLARLYLDGEDVADILINAGLALPYDGGRRQEWCDILPPA